MLKKVGIPVQREAASRLSYTDGDKIHFSNQGVPMVLVSIPLRYMHMPAEVADEKDVDVLTLTATPIPRTLHMSLIGIRDMSVLEEPPMDRVPIQTYVMEYDEETVREAIRRELRRGGQVYYVYNRVNDIAEVALRMIQTCAGGQSGFCTWTDESEGTGAGNV